MLLPTSYSRLNLTIVAMMWLFVTCFIGLFFGWMGAEQTSSLWGAFVAKGAPSRPLSNPFPREIR